MEEPIDISKFLDRRTLILGDVNTGKTSLSRAVLCGMCRQGLAPRIAVIDLAPEIPEVLALHGEMKGVGGKLLPPSEEDIIYLSTSLLPPRLSSKNETEAIERARANSTKIAFLFREYGLLGRDILFINDISLALQADSADNLLSLIRGARTLVANGYYGKKLGSSELSRWERQQMDSLTSSFDQIISL